jgi:hypothetical protein
MPSGEVAMLITRRRTILGAGAAGLSLVLGALRATAEMFEGVPVGEAPGDEGYKHELYHDEYEKLFGDLGHCGCGHGECRVTAWRKTQLDSDLGFDVIVYREWVPLLNNCWMPEPEQVPAKLRREWAHICAYQPHADHHMGNITVSVRCALINIKDN